MIKIAKMAADPPLPPGQVGNVWCSLQTPEGKGDKMALCQFWAEK